MPVTYPEIRKFLGLYLQRNSFNVPDGAMEQALNVIINDDDVISKLKGFYDYFSGGANTLNNLFFYQNTLLAIFNNKLSYFTDTGSSPNQTGSESVLSGETVAVTAPRRSRSVQESGNLYATSDNGVLKIDAFNGKIFGSGSPPGLDLQGTLDAANGVFPGDSAVAYRVVFGRRDANDNLILGAPSDTLVLSNVERTTISWTRAANVVTVSPGLGHNIVAGMTIVVTASTGATPVTLGTYTVTATTTTTFSFAETAANDTGTLDYTVSRRPILEFSVPSQITTDVDKYFYQVYRSSFTSSAAVSPLPDFRLVEESLLTSAQITARLVFYMDEVDPTLVTFAPELYTNPNSREGELQANDRPPKCEDMTLFKGYVIFANCITRHLINIDVVSPADLANGDFIEVKISATTRRYVARTGVGNTTVTSESVTFVLTTITVNYTAHGLLAGDTIYVSNAVGTGTLPAGTYTITSAAANSFDFTAGAAPTTLTALDFQGVTNGTFPIFTLDNTSSSVATQLSTTARGIVKAINRDSLSLIYARYVSNITDVPGKMQFSAKGFGDPMFWRANTTTAGQAFSPPFPDSFASGDQVFSRNDSRPNVFFSSKLNEPEAAPIANQFTVGPKNEPILRCIALRDSIIFLTEGGVYRCTGDGPFNFTVTALDTTIKSVAADSADLLNNQVLTLSNQGICSISESSAQIISRKIENVIEPIVGLTNISTQTSAVGYESDRTYRISTIKPNETTKTTTYIYNVLNDSWTESDKLFVAAVIGPNDTLYQIDTANKIQRERKNQTRLDFSGQNFPITVVSVASDMMSAVISISGGGVPEVGDIINKNNVFSRISAVTLVGANYNIEFYRPTNLVAADSLILYKKYGSRIRMSPFHAGQVGRNKQFTQMQLHTRSSQVTRIKLTFSGQTYGGSEEAEWLASNVGATSQAGWGELPWGFFPWGLNDGINTSLKTEPAPIIRIYVPRFQQRNTFIQAEMLHEEAGENLEIQALSWTVRGYGERVSK